MGVDVTTPAISFGHLQTRQVGLLRVQLAWLPADPSRRYRDQYLIDIDWVERSHTNVNVYDGQLRAIRERDLLYDSHDYFCDQPGDARVDSIDEIAARRMSVLTAQERATLGPYQDPEDNQVAWDDSNGDGSICDSDERSSDTNWITIDKITLAVYPPAAD